MNMKQLLLILMLFETVNSTAQFSEWKVFVPNEPTLYQGIYADNNEGVIIGYDTEEIYFGDFVPFTIPDQTAVSGFSLVPTEDVLSIWLTFSTPVDNYLAGDVIECINDICTLIFSATESLPVPDSIVIDALHYTGQLMKVSFNVGFVHHGQYIDPKNLYSVFVSDGQTSLTAQTSGSDIGFPDNSNMVAYSDSFSGDGYITYINADVVYDRPLDIIFPNELLRINSLDPSAYTTIGLSTETKMITAFHGFHSGITGFVNESIDVDENAGSVNIEIYRQNGSEGYMELYVRSQDGSAEETVDFNFENDFISWSNGNNEVQSVPLSILNNQNTDGTRTLFLTLESSSQFASIWPLHEIIEIRIIDDEMDDLIFADDFD